MPVYCSCTCWTVTSSRKGLVKYTFSLELDFVEFWHGAGNLYEVVRDKAIFFLKCFFAQKLGKWAENRLKIVYLFICLLNLKKNLVIHFHWTCSIMKIYIICCVPTQALSWGKSCFWNIDQNAPRQSDYRSFQFWCKFTKIKSWSKTFWLGIVKNGCGQSGL